MFLWLFILLSHMHKRIVRRQLTERMQLLNLCHCLFYTEVIMQVQAGYKGGSMVQLHTQRHNFVWSIFCIAFIHFPFFVSSFSYKNQTNNFMTFYLCHSSSSLRFFSFLQKTFFLGDVRVRQSRTPFNVCNMQDFVQIFVIQRQKHS